jgi:hypothetical protein
MLDTLTALAGLVLLALMLGRQRRDPWPQRRRELPVLLMYCARCMHREGEDCINPATLTMGRAVARCAAVLNGAGCERLAGERVAGVVDWKTRE